MQLNFRWYGKQDPISLHHIRQIPGMQSVVGALFDIPGGHDWPLARLESLKQEINEAGLTLDVIESLPVHEDIKLGRATRDELIAVYQENIRKLGQVGVSVICYNFMPLFDWFRTDLAMVLPDGSNTMQFDHAELENAPDPWAAKLPAYFELDDSPENIKRDYLAMSEEDLWQNLKYFLNAIVPVAAEYNIKMAIHPDDPPWPIFGLPRIITGEASLERLIKVEPHPANGITFCTGAFGANPKLDLPAMIRRFGDRIYFAHVRNVKHTADRQFHESSHLNGDISMLEIMKAFKDIGYTGPLRPDHGRMIWGEEGQPGYGLYDRALGAMYLKGLWDAL